MRIITVETAGVIIETTNCDYEIDEDRSEGRMNEVRTFVSSHADDGEYHSNDNIILSANNETLAFETRLGTKVHLKEGTD